MPEAGGAEQRTIGTLRALILSVLLIGMLGTLAELYLLEHTEGWWQLAPMCLLAAGSLAVVWSMIKLAPASLHSLQALMVLYVLAGVIGTYQHYAGNAEFELEMYPSRAGFELFWESLKGATPTLVPGTMTMFGLLGLASIFRHPQLASKERRMEALRRS
ncbi:MAG: hypothetical protein IH849_07330 [Acidobacteria bacterium]|nr:hypothetical protein [Acidobacteriota bacterium]